jgi:hypothetical protein
MQAEAEQNDLDKMAQLFAFLQGTLPEGYQMGANCVPNLTPNQAWTVIWYIQELHWQLPDNIERCDLCGRLYDSWAEGDCLDYGDSPYNFCDMCVESTDWIEKAQQNPNRDLRPREDQE